MNVNETMETHNDDNNSTNQSEVTNPQEEQVTANSEPQAPEVSAENPSENQTESENETQKADVTNAEETTSSEIVENPPEASDENPVESAPEVASAPPPELYNEIYDELLVKQQNNEAIQIQVDSRTKGGFKAFYKDMPVFLPGSHAVLRKNPTDKELLDLVGQNLTVKITEMYRDETNRKTVVVSRKTLIEQDFWKNIHKGQVVSGPISSIASFGVFLDLGGFEGLIHVSRLSNVRVPNPADIYKKGQVLEAVVVEFDADKQRIALSRKELEKDAWDSVAEEFVVGNSYKGIVRRMIEVGAFVELKPGIDGLVRKNELSWLKRVNHPSEILKVDQEIDVKVLEVDNKKKNIRLSYRALQENPWPEMLTKYPVQSEQKGKVLQVVQQGVLVRINDEVDGFIPRSKMNNLPPEEKIPYKVGDEIDVMISDVAVADESLILYIQGEYTQERPKRERTDSRDNRGERGERSERGERKGRREKRDFKKFDDVKPKMPAINPQEDSSFSLADLLSEDEVKKLLDN